MTFYYNNFKNYNNLINYKKRFTFFYFAFYVDIKIFFKN